MRFSKKGAYIDIDKTEKEVMAAIKGGVNYLNTAYIYPGNEAAVGEILHRNKCRVKYAHAKGLPVIIMEPLRGGRLVNLLPESAKALFHKDKEKRTPAELTFKWLYDQPEVTCVLSGMNSMEMVKQNLKTASEAHEGCMTTSDKELVKKEIARSVKVGCTGCGYCMPCPKGVDIPGTFRCYNAMHSEGKR